MRLETPLDDARSWYGKALGRGWRHELEPGVLAALAQGEHCTEASKPVVRALEEGPGFAVIAGLDSDQLGREEALTIYWALGRSLGEPLAQNIEGDLLYDVRDTGRQVSEGARFSVTNAESTFHIDSAFSPRIPDYVGLLCLRAAQSGGRSQLVSACAVHDALLAVCPVELEALYGEFCFDRRGQHRAGEDPVYRAPIFAWDGRELTMRYLRYYIEAGHEREQVALSDAQARALVSVEQQLQRPDLRVEFDLEPGHMLFTNNHWILHNRTAFKDFADPALRRHCVRLWLGRRGE